MPKCEWSVEVEQQINENFQQNWTITQWQLAQETDLGCGTVSAGAHLSFLRSCNMVALLQEDDDKCIWMYEFTLYIFTVQ